MADNRIIKKYANRRLYDTETSQSITLQDVRDLIGAGQPVKVIEAKTDRDVTRSVLLQIVADQELLGRHVLSNEFLESMIRVNSNPMRDLARSYLEKVMTHLESQQESVEQAWSSSLEKSGLAEVGSLTFEPFRQFQNRMFALWTEALSPALGKSRNDDADNDN
ncbi:MAG: polyhydroxyalkanoate synthesis repressor PhaR [Wenzhouxiangella sp.]|nr:MAG: polyhydroxyalkanoate synthesis repressor PhaR [Wenzhouxiangella sp.]